MIAIRGLAVVLFGVAAFAPPSVVEAQDLDQAASLAFNDGRYIDAAITFFDAIDAYERQPELRAKAEYYVGRSLYKAGYLLPAYQFYGEVVNEGESHPYFLRAIEGLIDVAEAIGDDTLIPEIIDRKYGESFRRLKPEVLNTANYMVGMIAQRRGDFDVAKDYLEGVRRDSAAYGKARYLLAIMAVKRAADTGAVRYDEAIKHFTTIEELYAQATDESQRKLYRLALLGLARAYYSQGDFTKSIEAYENVPRFSDDWYDAMFESGWAYFQEAKFGRALGQVHAIQSPYFDDRYRSESFVLKATAYFQVCHFDRARKALNSFYRIYRPMAERLQPWLSGEYTDAELVDLIVNGDDRFPRELQRHLGRNPRFRKFLGQVQEVDLELKSAELKLPPSRFERQLVALLQSQREQRVSLTGKLVRAQLRREARFLGILLNQADLIALETTSAERKMLAAGKDITKGPRAKGPRPIIPDATYQYWAFQGEYWIDELGYYEHSIKDECVPEVFE